MLRGRFQQQMDALNLELVQMGTLAEHAIRNSSYALAKQDRELSNKVIAAEKEIDALKNDIEAKALKILLMQQPVATDLRKITTALKIISDMERIGDQCRDVCEIILLLCDEKYQVTLEILPLMAELANKMVRNSIESFVRQDLDIAKAVIEDDEIMDDYFKRLKLKCINALKEKPAAADQIVYFLMIGKYFEKIGDHAENIAQWVIFSKLGEHKHIKLL